MASLQGGGAERVCATLCNRWAETGWDVTIATFDDGSTPPCFPLAPRVRHVTLDLKRRSKGLAPSVAGNVRRISALRRFVASERPERIVSFIDSTNVLVLIAAKGTGIPVIVSERTDPNQHPIPVPWRLLRRATYPWARAVVLQTRAAASYFPASWASRIAVIPNPVARLAPSPTEPTDGRLRRIIGMGRLAREKGFDLLIRAFAAIAPEHPGWELTILGEGPEREALVRQAEASGVGARVRLPGWEADATSVLRRADLFVLSSRYEGFPNVLCEAMACGLPVVAFDCPSGPSEIVRDGVDGLLVPPENVPALSATISSLIAAPERMRRLGERAREVSDRYSIERAAALWQSLLESAA